MNTPRTKSRSSSPLKASRSPTKSLKGLDGLTRRSSDALQALDANSRDRSLSPKRAPLLSNNVIKSTRRVQVFSDAPLKPPFKLQAEAKDSVFDVVDRTDSRRQGERDDVVVVEDENVPSYVTPERPRIREFPVGDCVGPLLKARERAGWPLSAPARGEKIYLSGMEFGDTRRRLFEIFEDRAGDVRRKLFGDEVEDGSKEPVEVWDDENKENIDPLGGK